VFLPFFFVLYLPGLQRQDCLLRGQPRRLERSQGIDVQALSEVTSFCNRNLKRAKPKFPLENQPNKTQPSKEMHFNQDKWLWIRFIFNVRPWKKNVSFCLLVLEIIFIFVVLLIRCKAEQQAQLLKKTAEDRVSLLKADGAIKESEIPVPF